MESDMVEQNDDEESGIVKQSDAELHILHLNSTMYAEKTVDSAVEAAKEVRFIYLYTDSLKCHKLSEIGLGTVLETNSSPYIQRVAVNAFTHPRARFTTDWAEGVLEDFKNSTDKTDIEVCQSARNLK